MDKNLILQKIVELKTSTPQTQETKLEIQKLQQKLDEKVLQKQNR